MLKTLLATLMLLAAAPVAAAPLTIKQGETWLFQVSGGEPAKARRAKPGAKPARGEIKASLSALMGTTLTLTNAGPTSYTFRAQLIGAKANEARTCALPANGKPVLEFWPAKASAVRLSGFKPAASDPNCPAP